MKPNQIGCPSCGATHDVHNPGLITFTCEYCGNAVFWDEEKIQDAGKQSVLPEGFSRLYRGASGTLLNKEFIVLGRVRYSFGKGFWDEWFLEFSGGKTGWLSEDNHEFCWEKEQSVVVPPYDDLYPGYAIKTKERQFIVEEVGLAECIGMEGDLPRLVKTGETYHFADAASPDGNHTMGIEYDDQPPTVFIGRWVKYASIKMEDEGTDW